MFIGILFVLYASCTQDKKTLGPASAEFLVELDSVENKRLIDPIPPFEHQYLENADSLRDQRDHQGAIRLYQRAAERFEKEENWEGQVKAVNEQSHALYWIDELDSAAALLQFNLSFALDRLDSNHPLIAETHFYLGKCYHHNFEPSKSLRHHQIALKLRREVFGEWAMEVADSYEGLGRLYQFRIKNHNQAESNLKKSIEILERIGGSEGRLSTVYNALASNYREMSDFHKALDIAKVVASRRYREDSTSKRYLNSMAVMANIYIELEDYSAAIRIYNSVINTVRDIYGPFDNDLSNYYNNLGSTYISIGDKVNIKSPIQKNYYDSANFFIQIGKQIAIRNSNLNFLSNCYFNLGRNYTQLSQFDSAYYYFEECRLLDRMTPELISREMGTLYESFDSLGKALTYYQKALNYSLPSFNDESIYYNPTPSPELSERTIFEILSDKASAFKDLADHSGELKDLIATFDTFLLLEKANDFRRNSQFAEASKLFLIDYYQTKFGGAIQTAVELFQLTNKPRYLDAVFYLMEKSKSMLLFKALYGVENADHSGVPDSILVEERRIKSELASLRRLLSMNEDGKHSNTTEIDQLQEKLLDLTQNRDQLSQYIQQHFPTYYQFKYDSVTLALGDIQELLNKDQTVLSYYWGDSLIYLMSISKDQAAIDALANPDSLQSLINTYTELIHNPPKVTSLSHEKEQFETYNEVSYALFQRLIKPALLEIEKGSEIIIVPDGPLSQVPFESLTTSRDISVEVSYKLLPYLNKQHLISYGYSVNLLFNSGAKSAVKTKPQVLAFGYTANEAIGSDQKALPGSAKEIAALNGIISGQFYLGKQASKQHFKENAPNFDILHLAVHGIADFNDELSSKLQFQRMSASDDESDLYAYELYGMDLSRAQLAVLSACETGIGKRYKGEGTFSIARGFAYAGVPSIVMSLWKVDDEASAQLMKNFYQEIESGQPISQALAKAKNQYISSADQYKSHPAYWASFVSLGETNSVVKGTNAIEQHLIWFLLGTAVLVIGLVVIKFSR